MITMFVLKEFYQFYSSSLMLTNLFSMEHYIVTFDLEWPSVTLVMARWPWWFFLLCRDSYWLGLHCTSCSGIFWALQFLTQLIFMLESKISQDAPFSTQSLMREREREKERVNRYQSSTWKLNTISKTQNTVSLNVEFLLLWHYLTW